LPVSSTAHLRISEALFHIDLANGYWKMYTIVINWEQSCACRCISASALRNSCPRSKGERGDRTVLTHPLGLVSVAFCGDGAAGRFC